MRFRYILIGIMVTAFAALLNAQGPATEGAALIEKLKFPEMTWDIPELGKDVLVDTLDNGIVLFIMEDHRLPIFNIRGLVRTGGMYDPDDLHGLASLTGKIIRAGGTKNIEPDSLNAMLEYLAASIETWIGSEQGGVSLNCLSKDADQCLGLLADVLVHPEFRQKYIDLEKDKIKESIIRRNDNPGRIAGREFDHVIYGDHFYGRIQEWEPIGKITREDMVAFYDSFFAPNNLWLGITGDFDADDIKAKISELFSGWSPKDIDFPETPKVNPEFKPGVFLIDKDVTQSNIFFGHLGVDEYSPDRFALAVMNYILGGGSFTSRMTSVVRGDMGLAYSVGSVFETRNRDLGEFYAYCQTKTESTYDAIFNMLDQVKKIREGEVSDYELNSAKDSYINRFVFNFTDPSSIVSQLMNLEYDNMPRDYYKNYIANLQAVTVKDVLRVAREYLKPDQITFLVVGNTKDFADQLKEFGTVKFIELTEPVVDAGI